jgi:hypothetical protein
VNKLPETLEVMCNLYIYGKMKAKFDISHTFLHSLELEKWHGNGNDGDHKKNRPASQRNSPFQQQKRFERTL